MKVLKLDEEMEKLLHSVCDAVLKGHGMGAIDAVNRLRYLISLAEEEKEVEPEIV